MSRPWLWMEHGGEIFVSRVIADVAEAEASCARLAGPDSSAHSRIWQGFLAHRHLHLLDSHLIHSARRKTHCSTKSGLSPTCPNSACSACN